MRIPTPVSNYLLANKIKHSRVLSMDVYDLFGISLTPKQIVKHLCYKGAAISKRGDTYTDVPKELTDKFKHHYVVQRRGVWMIRAKQANQTQYTGVLLSKALLEYRHGITISPQVTVLHLNDDVSDMSDRNIVAVPRGVYNRAVHSQEYRTGGLDLRRVIITVAWSEHLLYLTCKYKESERADVRSKIARQIQSDINLYNISGCAIRVD